MIQLQLETAIAAPRDRVWEILADHEGMTRWFPAREVVRRRPGTPDPNGAGAVRVLRVGGLALEEKITEFKPRERIEYVVLEGAPFVQHRAEVTLAGQGDGTRVRWSVVCAPRVPGTGWLIRRLHRRILAKALEGLRRYAEAGA